MSDFKIEKATKSEALQLQAIGRQTFYETFATSNTEENMQAYLEEGFSIEKIEGELGCKASEFYFAKTGNEIVGYLKINFANAQTELKAQNSLEVERIYVLKDFHGKNVGQLLFDKAMEVAIENDVDFVWLGVWENNQRAINFYKRNGFVEFDRHIFKLGSDEQTDLMMKLDLGKIHCRK